MKIEYTQSKKLPEFWPLHWAFAQPMLRFNPLFRRLCGLETRLVHHRLKPVHDPVYICGLARSGTTITLEILNSHPDVASFCYGDMVQPWLPFAWNRIAGGLFLNRAPVQERPHGDGLVMAQNRPEAVEEIFWQQAFSHVHDEKKSGVLDAASFNSAFNGFYKNQIAKLLLAKAKTRYLAKANYHVTRLAYLKRMFPRGRFIILVRHPLGQMVSYLKQQERLTRLYRSDPRWWEIARELGHFEFGDQMQFINAGNGEMVGRIRALWEADRRIEAFGWYWQSIYAHLHQTVTQDPDLMRSCLFIRYEDLCHQSAAVIDTLLDHCRLDRNLFRDQRQKFVRTLHLPDYYSARISGEEKKCLNDITSDTAALFGYKNH